MAGETVTSSKVASTVQARGGTGLTSVHGTYEITANTQTQLADVFQMVKVPKGARIVNVILGTDDIDTGTALVLDVGDGTVTDRFIDGATIGQTGGVAYLNEVDGIGYVYTADDTIDVICQVAAQTPVTSGTINLTVVYDMQQA